ncbi:hypothetical protein OHB00_36245 [Streptomyces sp. NBC_00631]|uniref:hypothetical protein n=1 Tax=Streptomyces sp. NBC_00631 TaxID=2975793 RepID=UPI0030E056FF
MTQHRRPRLSRTAKTLLAASVALAAAAGVTVAQAGESSRKCTAFDTIALGKYYLNDNLWGQDKGTGTQCVWDNSRSASTISWGTSHTWANNNKGSDSDVKSYASTVLGWHWGWKPDKASTGLPIRVGDGKMQRQVPLRHRVRRRGVQGFGPAGHHVVLRRHRLTGASEPPDRQPIGPRGLVGAARFGYQRSSSTGR